ncbi:MAG: hypothetical protein WC516_09130 [Patescibacteria group bacterium]|jgi:hypothetical protein
MRHEVNYNGSKIIISFRCRGYSIHCYDAELLEGDWPKDSDLIALCDNTDPAHPCNFGGHVSKFSNKASIEVYVD